MALCLPAHAADDAAKKFQDDFLAGKLDWAAVQARAKQEGTVNLYYWGGSRPHQCVDGPGGDTCHGRARRDARSPVQITDTKDAIDLVAGGKERRQGYRRRQRRRGLGEWQELRHAQAAERAVRQLCPEGAQRKEHRLGPERQPRASQPARFRRGQRRRRDALVRRAVCLRRQCRSRRGRGRAPHLRATDNPI